MRLLLTKPLDEIEYENDDFNKYYTPGTVFEVQAPGKNSSEWCYIKVISDIIIPGDQGFLIYKDEAHCFKVIE